MKISLYILAIAFGIFLVIYGGIDDSPGGQLMGLGIAVVGILGIVRRLRKPRKRR
jgi:hypothetical protein